MSREDLLNKYIYGEYVDLTPTNDAEVAIIKYGLLKYPNYVLNYKFNQSEIYDDDPFLDGVAMFALLVYNHPIDLYPNIIPNISLLTLSYASIDDFPIPNYESFLHIYKNNNYINWSYFISGWSILGDYSIENEDKDIYYHSDHYFLAKKYNKRIPDKYNMFMRECGFYGNVYTDIDIDKDHDDLLMNSMLLKSYDFKTIHPTLNTICLLESNNWERMHSTFEMDYDEMKKEEDMFILMF